MASRLMDGTKRRLLELFVLGVPVYRQSFRALASAPAIERFYRLLRACCAHAEELRDPFEGPIECDETTIGGARHGKRGWGAAGKVIVLGILQRNGQVKVFAVPAREGNRVIGLVRDHTKPGSLYYTDDWLLFLARPGRPRGGPEGARPTERSRSHQRDRRLLELCQKLAVSIPRSAPKTSSSFSGGDLLPFQLSRRGPLPFALQEVKDDWHERN